MNIWHDISADRIKKDDFIAVVEIEKGGTNKYELDKATGLLRLDRVLYTATHYPANYGFIPRTYAGDGDPLDVLVICQEKIVPLTLVECYPIGVMLMTDNDDLDEKIIAIPKSDPFLKNCKDIKDLPEQYSAEIMHFFEVYKQLEDKKTEVKEMLGREEAEKIIEKCINNYNEKVFKIILDCGEKEMLERIIFNILSFSLFIIIFFKIIKKNDTTYVAPLILEAIGIAIGLIEILIGRFLGTFIRVITYLLAIVLPLAIILIEKYGLNFSEMLYIFLARLCSIFNNSKKAKQLLMNLINKYPESYNGHRLLSAKLRKRRRNEKSYR